MPIGLVAPKRVAAKLDTLATSIAAKPGITSATVVPSATKVDVLRRHIEVDGVTAADVQAAVDSNVRKVNHGGATGGTFTLTVDGQTTAGIAYNASATSVKSALEALSTVTTATVTGTGTVADPWVITLDDTGSDRTVTGDGSGLTGGALTVTTPVADVQFLPGAPLPV